MPRHAPAVGRIVSILNFFVEQPQQALTLTEIIKSLQLSRATAHALLLSLVESGYLYRCPDKSYVLGPALISLAMNAQQHFSPLAVARQEMRLLADELDVVAGALFREGDELVVHERAAPVSQIGKGIPAGQRYPLHPRGSFFLMPMPDPEINEELDRVHPALSALERQDIHAQIAFARRHGFVLGVRETDDPEPQVRRADILGKFLTKLELDEPYRVQFLLAPVLSEHGRVEFGIVLYGFSRTMTGAEVSVIGHRLREACKRITTFIAGKRAGVVLQAP